MARLCGCGCFFQHHCRLSSCKRNGFRENTLNRSSATDSTSKTIKFQIYELPHSSSSSIAFPVLKFYCLEFSFKNILLHSVAIRASPHMCVVPLLHNPPRACFPQQQSIVRYQETPTFQNQLFDDGFTVLFSFSHVRLHSHLENQNHK